MDHYAVLGVSADADAATVRRAYLALARRHHPDGHTAAGPAAVARAERRMQEVNGAWAVLGDPVARAAYDREQQGGSLPPAVVRPSTRPAQGPGWRPRADDDGWMDDFQAWRDEVDDVVPPERPRTPRQRLFTVLPVLLFGASLVVGLLGLVLDARPVLAASFVGVMASVMLLVTLTMVEMRGRDGR